MSTTTTENTMSTEDMKRAIGEAKTEQQTLYRELDSLPQRIRDAQGAAVAERAAAASVGLAYEDADEEVEALRRREGEIQLELWNSKIRSAALRRDLAREEEAQAVRDRPAAKQELQDAREVLEAAKQRQGDAVARYDGCDRRQDTARGKRREAEAELARLQEDYPDAG